MGECAVLGCPFVSSNPNTAQLQPFPDDSDLLNKWITFCGRDNSFWIKRTSPRICRCHFGAKMRDGSTGHNLKGDAYPDCFGPETLAQLAPRSSAPAPAPVSVPSPPPKQFAAPAPSARPVPTVVLQTSPPEKPPKILLHHCLVCGEGTDKKRYTKMVCESCARFFGACALKRIVPTRCIAGTNRCAMGPTSYKCALCRLRKCEEVGMEIARFGQNSKKPEDLRITKSLSASPSTDLPSGAPAVSIYRSEEAATESPDDGGQENTPSGLTSATNGDSIVEDDEQDMPFETGDSSANDADISLDQSPVTLRYTSNPTLPHGENANVSSISQALHPGALTAETGYSFLGQGQGPPIVDPRNITPPHLRAKRLITTPRRRPTKKPSIESIWIPRVALSNQKRGIPFLFSDMSRRSTVSFIPFSSKKKTDGLKLLKPGSVVFIPETNSFLHLPEAVPAPLILSLPPQATPPGPNSSSVFRDTGPSPVTDAQRGQQIVDKFASLVKAIGGKLKKLPKKDEFMTPNERQELRTEVSTLKRCMKRKVKNRDKKVKDLTEQLKEARKTIAALESSRNDAAVIDKWVEELDSPILRDMCKAAQTPKGPARHGAYTDNLKEACCQIYTLSPSAYVFMLQNKLPVPSVSVMRNLRLLDKMTAPTPDDVTYKPVRDYSKTVRLIHEQRAILEDFFAGNTTPTHDQYTELMASTDLSRKKLARWFMNQRKFKRIEEKRRAERDARKEQLEQELAAQGLLAE